MDICESYGCDGLHHPVAEHRDRKTGELILTRPIVDEMDELLCGADAPEGQRVSIAMARCSCRKEPEPEAADDREPVAAPVYEETEREPLTPWWGAG